MTSMQHQQQFISPFSVENIISKKSDKDTDEPLNHSSGSSSGYGKFFVNFGHLDELLGQKFRAMIKGRLSQDISFIGRIS